MKLTLLEGDCRDAMLAIEPGTVDAVITDPPYGLEFMGRGWDHGVPGRSYFRAMYEAAKPGAHLFAFGGTRLFHRMACAIEDAGWEVRDTLSWMYGSGFPKSLDVSKAIDSAAGVEREVGGHTNTICSWWSKGEECQGHPGTSFTGKHQRSTVAATEAARRFDGYGTALKPAWEPIILARKPLEGTVAANVQAHGCGALNIDGGRVGADGASTRGGGGGGPSPSGAFTTGHSIVALDKGRWPANVVLDEEAAAMLDAGQPITKTPKAISRGPSRGTAADYTPRKKLQRGVPCHGDSGGPSRFFYCAKASKKDRIYTDPETGEEVLSDHPTVKPIALMRWLVRLALPPGGGVVLDPFMGSGSTGVACAIEGASRFIGCERVEHFRKIARARIEAEM